MEIRGKTLDEIDDSAEIESMKKVEAVLFISGRFLTIQELITNTDLNPLIIREALEKLKEKYNNEASAIEIIQKDLESGSGKMWKMSVKQEHSHVVNKLATGSSEFSKAEQETLAIIAYKQPIKQSVIIKIRGNKAYDHIKKFFDVGLLKKKRFGHTWELSLSEEFYDYFSLEKKQANSEKEDIETKEESSMESKSGE